MSERKLYFFHRQTGMRYHYDPSLPLARNPQVVVIDEAGNEVDPVAAQAVDAPKRKRRKARSAVNDPVQSELAVGAAG